MPRSSNPHSLKAHSLLLAALLVAACGASVFAQQPDRILHSINESQVITLTGNVHPLARGEFDLGAVEDGTVLNRMMLELEPSAAQQTELDALVTAQHDPASPLYQQWLTPAQYGHRFGASSDDLARITAWLRSHGFTIVEVAASNRLIQFSGTAAQVAEAFHTEIHRYRVNGVEHIGNAQDPQIPEALAGVVGGVVSLHDFRRTSEISAKRSVEAQQAATGLENSAAVDTGRAASATPEYSSGTTHYLFPADWATIYDLNPLFTAGTKGSGASIAIVGRSNINLSDVASFRSASALPANQPTVILVSTNPGLVSGDQDESTLDVEWSGATAPAATVKFVVGASTSTTDGVDLSAQYIVNHSTANVVSTSYGSCEQDMGSSELAFYNALWQQAASEGISALVSSGDSGAAGCDSGSSSKGTIAAVNGLCSSPYSTCVGGTEFNEGGSAAQYWASTNTSADGSALSYIPEKVWNESASNGGSGLWSSGGGASSVYAQPSWQKGIAGASLSNGMRAVPDVALSAAGHDGYIIVEDGSYWVISGTSAASPSFAGVMALVVQSQGGKGQGNANTSLYALVNASKNPFHATPSGSNTVPGVSGFTASGAAYNQATGLGSVDGALLVSDWGAGSGVTAGVNFALSQSAASGTALAGKTVTYTVNVTESGSAKNAVALSVKAPAGITASVSPASITPGTAATVTLIVASTATAGADSIVVTGSNSSGTQTVTYALTVTQAPTLSVSPAAASVSVALGSTGSVGLNAVVGGTFTGNITWSVSGLPAGVAAAWSANPVAPSASGTSTPETLTLTAASTAKIASSAMTVTAAGSGLTASSQITLAVTQAPGITLAVSPVSVSMQSLGTATATVTATPVGGLKPASAGAGSSISISAGLPKGIAAGWSAPSVTTAGTVVWTLTLAGSSSALAGASTLSLAAKVAPATGAAVTAAATLPLTVTLTPPTLAVSAASSTLAVIQGKSVADGLTLAGNGTYSGAVTLSVSGLPTGVTAAWSSSTVTLNGETGSSTLTLAAASSAPLGSATVTITAKGDGLTVTKQVTLQVTQAPGLQLALSASSLSMTHTGTASVTVSMTELGGLNIPTTLMLAGLPAGVTPSLTNVKAGAAGAESGTITFTGSNAAKTGTVTLTIGVSGNSGGVTYTAQQTLALQLK
jgi:pseudomonalisin